VHERGAPYPQHTQRRVDPYQVDAAPVDADNYQCKWQHPEQSQQLTHAVFMLVRD